MSSSKRQQPRTITPKEFALLEREVELVCHECGKKGKYGVGRIFLDPEIVGGRGQEEPRISEAVAFTGYFHCRHCGAGGPWDLPASTMMLLMALMLEAQQAPHQARIHLARLQLFDGTVCPTATAGEAHLRQLIDANPDDNYLWSRLGNLYDSAERKDLAFAAYSRAVELNCRDVESQYTLGCYQMEQGERPRVGPFHPGAASLPRGREMPGYVAARHGTRHVGTLV